MGLTERFDKRQLAQIEKQLGRETSIQIHVRRMSDYRAVVTEDGIACEHPKRAREFIRWGDVREIAIRTTSDGPWLPDMWVLFVGGSGGCSVPTEAADFDAVNLSD